MRLPAPIRKKPPETAAGGHFGASRCVGASDLLKQKLNIRSRLGEALAPGATPHARIKIEGHLNR